MDGCRERSFLVRLRQFGWKVDVEVEGGEEGGKAVEWWVWVEGD